MTSVTQFKYIWGCTHREAKVGHEALQINADSIRRITETEVTNERHGKHTKSSQTNTALTWDMENHAAKCFQRFCGHACKGQHQYWRNVMHGSSKTFKPEHVNSPHMRTGTHISNTRVEHACFWPEVADQICCGQYLLARSVTHWSKLCVATDCHDCYINHTQHYRQTWVVRNKLELFQDTSSAEDITRFKIKLQQEYSACLDHKHFFQFLGCSKNKQ